MKISCVIPVYKNLQLFERMVERNLVWLNELEVIVVDDASGEQIKEMVLKHMPQAKVIVHARNTGFGSSVNDGVAATTGEAILLLNSDVALQDDSYKKAAEILKSNDNLFAVSFSQIEKDGSRVGKNTVFFEDGFIRHLKLDSQTAGLNGWAEGGSCLMRKSTYMQLGGFNPWLNPFYGEDVDLSFRAYRSGYEVRFDPKIVVEHHHESTISKFFSKQTMMMIGLRNQWLYTWTNIRTPKYILSGIWASTKMIGINTLRGQFFLLASFTMALIRLPFAFLWSIRHTRPIYRDEEVFDKLKNHAATP